MPSWDRVLFILGCMFLVFFYGTAVGKYEVFPHDYLKEAKEGLEAFVETYAAAEADEQPTHRTEGGVTVWDRDAALDGVTLLGMRQNNKMVTLVVDMEGNELQRWELPYSSVWPDAPHIIRQAADDEISWHGIHVFPNGDLLFNYQGANFPGGGGLVLVDLESKVRWSLARNTHHDLEVQPDGSIIVGAHEYRENGVDACRDYLVPPYYEDKILLISAEGEIQDEFSVLEALCRSPYRTVLMPTAQFSYGSDTKIEYYDPTHLNNVNVLAPELADKFPMAKAGDILVSLRNLNLIGFIDRETRLFGWALTGHWVRQHDPDLLPDGHIMLFDNRGGSPERGGSRILEIDPLTQQVIWSFEGVEGDPFDTEAQGEQEPLPNGNVLIAETLGGRAIEVTRDEPPRIVWEYVNLRERTEAGGIVERLVHARRYPREALAFLDPPQS